MSGSENSRIVRPHASPHLGLVAVIFTALFLAGLYPVTIFGGTPYFPAPTAPPDAIVTFFQARPGAVLACAFFHFGAAIVLGIFTASIVSPAALFLVPLTRFPGFIWLIAAGFSMSNTSGTRTQASLAHAS
jgi:hypothetical protein